VRHDHHAIGTAILGGFLLFAILAVLIILGPQDAGQATTGTRVFIINATPVNCTVVAEAGYNIISIPCISNAQPLASVISDTDLWAMYQYTPTTSDKWRVYNPNLPWWVVSDLSFLSRRVGYVLVLNASQNYTTSGLAIPSTDVPIIAGWSLAGYPSLNVTNITAALDGANDSLTEVRTYYPTSNGYRRYFVATQTGNLTNLTPGFGYWLNGTTSDTWTVNQ
jgi:hypothetical protein